MPVSLAVFAGLKLWALRGFLPQVAHSGLDFLMSSSSEHWPSSTVLLWAGWFSLPGELKMFHEGLILIFSVVAPRIFLFCLQTALLLGTYLALKNCSSASVLPQTILWFHLQFVFFIVYSSVVPYSSNFLITVVALLYFCLSYMEIIRHIKHFKDSYSRNRTTF